MDHGIAQNCGFFAPAQQCNPQNETYQGLWQASAAGKKGRDGHRFRREGEGRSRAPRHSGSQQLLGWRVHVCLFKLPPWCAAGAHVAADREWAGVDDGALLCKLPCHSVPLQLQVASKMLPSWPTQCCIQPMPLLVVCCTVTALQDYGPDDDYSLYNLLVRVVAAQLM